jgi:ferric-dicitrate binding protein FerR (iron transport regulator)
MSSESTKVRRVLGTLRDGPLSLHTGEHSELRRRRIVGKLRKHVRDVPLQRARSRRRRLLGGVLLSASAVAAAMTLWFAESRPATAPAARVTKLTGTVNVVRTGQTKLVTVGDLLDASSGEIATEQAARATVTLPNGVEVDVSERSRAAFPPSGEQQRMTLRQGEVTCRVPRLGQEESFAVVTPTARVVVHGTIFSVRVLQRPDGTSGTCVRVSEGAVIVHGASGQIALNSGQAWGCETPRADEPLADLEPKDAPAARETPKKSAIRKPAGTLELEARLLQQALVAERRGDPDAAARTLRQLLRDYPSSPLADDARAALARVSRRTGSER